MSKGWPNLVLLVLVLAAVFAMRLPWTDEVVVDWDESVYFVVAQDLARGGTLYETAWDHKGPFLFFLLSLPMRVFGSSLVAIRLFTTAYLLVSMILVWLVSRRLFARDVALLPPLLYGAFFSVPTFKGLASFAELFMMGPAILALYGLLRYLGDEAKGWWLALTGAAAVVGVMTKFSAAHSVVIIPLFLLARRLGRSERDIRPLLREAGWCAAGAGAVLAGVLLYFVAHSTLDELVMVYRFNYKNVNTVSSSEGWIKMVWFMGWTATRDLFTMLCLLGTGFLALTWRQWSAERWKAGLVYGLLLTSFFGVALGRNVFVHYYLQMALPFALVVGLALHVIDVRPQHLRRVAAAGLLMLLVSALSPFRFDAVERKQDHQRNTTVAEVSRFLRDHTSPDDTIFVLGGDPVIYFLSERQAPTKYFFWLHHLGRWANVFASEGIGERELLPNLPRWFVYTEHESERAPNLEQIMYANYQLRHTIGPYQLAELRAPAQAPERPTKLTSPPGIVSH
jgi:4-amino-4-deoxy-L-arabinose transferase-like glycosyltransferase